MLLRAVAPLGSAMAEEFENYEARLTEARRAVERWEAEGGAREAEQPVERESDRERPLPPGEDGAGGTAAYVSLSRFWGPFGAVRGASPGH